MPDNDLHNGKELLSRIAGGDQRAFGELVGHYTSIIYGHLISYLKNAPQAEEVTQDIFMALWKHRSELPLIGNLQGYIYTMTRNRAYNIFQQKLQDCVSPPPDFPDHLTMTPAATTEYRQLYNMLMEGIAHLPSRRKQVFTLSRIERKSYEEIAAELSISKSAVKQHIIEALIFLRTYLREHADIVLLLSAINIFFP